MDGLALDGVSAIAADKYGYLWIGTWEGVSRFDGNEFFNYGQAEGLPADGVTSFLTTRDGVQWIGTFKGLCRYNPEGQSARKRFTVYQPSDVRESQKILALAEDRDGSILCATWMGIFRLRSMPTIGPFVKTLPAAAAPEYGVNIVGTNLTGTTGVTFNGIPATFTIASPTLIYTAVPIGATSGPVRVTTPTGPLTSNTAFQVLRPATGPSMRPRTSHLFLVAPPLGDVQAVAAREG